MFKNREKVLFFIWIIGSLLRILYVIKIECNAWKQIIYLTQSRLV